MLRLRDNGYDMFWQHDQRIVISQEMVAFSPYQLPSILHHSAMLGRPARQPTQGEQNLRPPCGSLFYLQKAGRQEGRQMIPGYQVLWTLYLPTDLFFFCP